MAIIIAHGSFVPFMLLLHDDGYVGVSKHLLSLRFNLKIGIMYLEQEMYYADGEVYEMILVQKNTTEVGSMWILGPRLFRVISIYESQMQASTIILTNEFGTSTVQFLSVAYMKLEHIDDSMFVLLDSKDGIYAFVDLSNMSSFPFRSVNSTPSQLFHACSQITMQSYVREVGLSMHTFSMSSIHPLPSFIGLPIVDALKLIKSRKKNQSKISHPLILTI